LPIITSAIALEAGHVGKPSDGRKKIHLNSVELLKTIPIRKMNKMS
jgi:hypothetical protein